MHLVFQHAVKSQAENLEVPVWGLNTEMNSQVLSLALQQKNTT